MTYKLDDELRILILKDDVLNLPVSPEFAFQLLDSVEKYRHQICAVSLFDNINGIDDLELLQQIALGNIIESGLNDLYGGK